MDEDQQLQPIQVEKLSSVDLLAKDYDYLLTMQLMSLSVERLDELRSQILKKQGDLSSLKSTSENELWIRDINKFLEVLEKVETAEQKKIDIEDKKLKKSVKAPTINNKLKRKKKQDRKEEDGPFEAEMKKSRTSKLLNEEKSNVKAEPKKIIRPK